MILSFRDEDALGRVISVDTALVVVDVGDLEKLRRLQVNRLVALQSDPGQYMIGIVQRITRRIESIDATLDTAGDSLEEDLERNEQSLVRVSLIGTLHRKKGLDRDVFSRTIETVPRIHALCFPLEDSSLSEFMRVVSNSSSQSSTPSLVLGHYTLDERAVAHVDGNRFFQRHAVIVGSTGSGKSCTTALLVEQIAELPNGNAIVFDIHGEYGTLESDEVRLLRIAGPSDVEAGKGLPEGIVHLPYWLLPSEALLPMFVDRDDGNAPNQNVIVAESVREGKRNALVGGRHEGLIDEITIDSPTPFNVRTVLKIVEDKDVEMTQGARGDRQGPYFGKLTRLANRLRSKIEDKRLGFLFGGGEHTNRVEFLDDLSNVLIGGNLAESGKRARVRVLDFSEVPSDILPLVIALVVRMVFSVQQWTSAKTRHPVALFCDEAHNYIPESGAGGSTDMAVRMFERVAKEGRKYGVGLVVITQRPSEVSRSVLSQCNNFIAMRLTNSDDQNRIKSLLPDSLGGFADVLPILDTARGARCRRRDALTNTCSNSAAED